MDVDPVVSTKAAPTDDMNLPEFEVEGDLVLYVSDRQSLHEILKCLKRVSGKIVLELGSIQSLGFDMLKIEGLRGVEVRADWIPIVNKYLPQGDESACRTELKLHDVERLAK